MFLQQSSLFFKLGCEYERIEIEANKQLLLDSIHPQLPSHFLIIIYEIYDVNLSFQTLAENCRRKLMGTVTVGYWVLTSDQEGLGLKAMSANDHPTVTTSVQEFLSDVAGRWNRSCNNFPFVRHDRSVSNITVTIINFGFIAS
jgi:hypothetical protein